jgi:uncharacterized protein
MDAPEVDPDRPAPIAVPHLSLAPETLNALIESFVLREGTEYGEHDVALATKVAQVRRQLERGEAAVYFDPLSESVDIVPTRTRAG